MPALWDAALALERAPATLTPVPSTVAPILMNGAAAARGPNTAPCAAKGELWSCHGHALRMGQPLHHGSACGDLPVQPEAHALQQSWRRRLGHDGEHRHPV